MPGRIPAVRCRMDHDDSLEIKDFWSVWGLGCHDFALNSMWGGDPGALKSGIISDIKLPLPEAIASESFTVSRK